MSKEAVKEVLDRDCLAREGKNCFEYQKAFRYGKGTFTPCWVCHRNEGILDELIEAVKK